jgi:hypothetical protein
MTNKKIDLSKINDEDIMPKNPSNMKCGPNIEFDNCSCIPLNILINMAESFNQYNEENNINDKILLDSRLDTLQPDNYKKYLLFQFKKRYDRDQQNWIKEKFIKYMSEDNKEMLENVVFRPEGPQGKFDWLSTLDINNVLTQYENKYSDFKFLGAVPMDFNDLDYLPFKNIDFDDFYKNNIYRIGVIFNLDESYKSGSHWVSLFIDLKKGQIYYSDSYGIRPENRVVNFMNKIENYLKKKGIYNIDIKHNKIQHQQGNSECGVYSINFILRLLKGKTFEHITRKRLTDNKVNKCRLKYFNKN